MKRDFGSNIIQCPLLKRDIFDAYCYDINMVRTRQMKPSILEDKIDMKAAEEFCPKCKFLPFEGSKKWG